MTTLPEPSAAPTVSVVTIFLDAEKYLSESIESVLAQNYRDFELVLVDDGSSDGSTAIARRYAEQYPERIHYTEHAEHRNLGMSASRNHGVRVSRGRLISFLDSDDIWLPERLSRFVAELERFPSAGWIYGPTLYWYSWAGDRVRELFGEDRADEPGKLSLPYHELIEPPYPLIVWLETTGGSLPGICSLLIRREAFASVGGFESEFQGLFEDQVFLSKIALKHPLVVLPDVLDYYRQHPGSHCYEAIKAGAYDPVRPNPSRARYLTWLKRYLATRGVTDRRLHRLLRRELFPYRSPVHLAIHNLRGVMTYEVREYLRRRLPPSVFHQLRLQRHRWRHFRARPR